MNQRRNLENPMVCCPCKAGRVLWEGVWGAVANRARRWGSREAEVTYAHSLSIYYVLVRLVVKQGIWREKRQLLRSCSRTVQNPPDVLSPSSLLCKSVRVDRMEGSVQTCMGMCCFGANSAWLFCSISSLPPYTGAPRGNKEPPCFLRLQGTEKGLLVFHSAGLWAECCGRLSPAAAREF